MELELGLAVHLRDVETLDDLGDVTAPPPVEPGDLVASAEHVYCVEAVLPVPPDSRCIPALGRKVRLTIAAR